MPSAPYCPSEYQPMKRPPDSSFKSRSPKPRTHGLWWKSLYSSIVWDEPIPVGPIQWKSECQKWWCFIVSIFSISRLLLYQPILVAIASINCCVFRLSRSSCSVSKIPFSRGFKTLPPSWPSAGGSTWNPACFMTLRISKIT